MTNAKEIRTIVGIIGSVGSILIQMLQMPGYIYIYKKKTVEGFYPDVTKVMGFSLWFLYGLALEDSILFTTSNGIGIVIEAIYLTVFIIYCDDISRGMNFCLYLLLELALFALFCYVLTLLPPEGFLFRRRMLIGFACCFFAVYKYTSFAMSRIGRMVETASVQGMPKLWVSFLCLITTGTWMLYSLIYKIDQFLLISSGFGTLVYASYLIVYASYFNSSYLKAKSICIGERLNESPI